MRRSIAGMILCWFRAEHTIIRGICPECAEEHTLCPVCWKFYEEGEIE